METPQMVIPYPDVATADARVAEINEEAGNQLVAGGNSYIRANEEHKTYFTDDEWNQRLPLTVSITFDKLQDYKLFASDRIILSAKNDAGLFMTYEILDTSTATGTISENILKPTSTGTLIIRASLNNPAEVHSTEKPFEDRSIEVLEATRFEKAQKYVTISKDLEHDIPVLSSIFATFTNDDIHNFHINDIDQETFNVQLKNGDKEANQDLLDDYVARRLVSVISREVRQLYAEREADMLEIGENL